MLDKELIIRREKVQELILKGYTQNEVADKLGVHYQTIHKDVRWLNRKYSKYVAKHPEYLKKKLDKILKFIDELNKIKKGYWELKDKAGQEIIIPGKKEGVELTIPRGSIDDERKMLDSIVKLITEQAKILQLTGSEDKYLQQNFIHIDQLNAKIVPLVEYFVQIIYKYVPEQLQKNALTDLQTYEENQKK